MSYPYFDSHCDTISACLHGGREMFSQSGALDFKRLQGYRPAGQIFAIFHDAAQAPPDGMWAECCRQHDFFLEQLQKNSRFVAFCRSGQEAETANQARLTAAMLSIEGADLLQCDCGLLEVAAGWGVKCLNLTWNRANALSGSCVEEPERGLSPLGREFVRRAEELGILIDVSHLSDAGFWDVMEIATRPVIASHSNSRRICPHPRNLTDEMFRALVAQKGYVGLNFYADFIGDPASAERLCDHICHFLDLGGEHILGLGGDWDGCSAMVEGITGVEELRRLLPALRNRKFSEKFLSDLFYSNLLALLRR